MNKHTLLSTGLALMAFSGGASAQDPGLGKRLFDQHCAVCHGESGRGDGPAAPYLFPKPRDFTQGRFKIRTTSTGELPTDQDLLDTLARGMPGSAMPSFGYLSPEERQALVRYLKSMAVDEEGTNLFKGGGTPPTVRAGDPPPLSPASVARGKRVYEKAGCAQCHGDLGRGDGPSAKILTDDWERSILPANLMRGVFRGGNSVRDIYLRFTTGMNGTPMPSYADTLGEEERWDLAYYVKFLAYPGRPEVSKQLALTKVKAYRREGQSLSTDPRDPSWERISGIRIPLMHLWQRQEAADVLTVRAMHDGKEIAFLLEWEDPKVDGLMIRPQDYPDAAAVMFSLTEPVRGHFSMGSEGKPVNIWQWRMDRQMDLAGFQDMEERYPRMVVDDYPLDAGRYPKRADRNPPPRSPASAQEPLFLAGLAAGNPMSEIARRSTVEDLNAEGFGTLTSQPAKDQDVRGQGIWSHDSWKVVLVRKLSGGSERNVSFFPGRALHAAFAVWDGGAGDRDGKKAVTYWQVLEVE